MTHICYNKNGKKCKNDMNCKKATPNYAELDWSWLQLWSELKTFKMIDEHSLINSAAIHGAGSMSPVQTV